MRTFKTSKYLLSQLETELLKNEIPYTVQRKNGEVFISCELSGTAFRKNVERAMCLTQQGNKKTPVITFREFLQEEYAQEKKKRGPKIILARDKKQTQKYFKAR